MTAKKHLTILLLAASACARQTTPEGGPKDLAPPTLARSTPANNDKNFHGKTLTLTFSEPVKLKDPREEIIIAPNPGKNVVFEAKQNRITIESKDGWKDSTTYSISFREGVQDITESNAAENLRLAFSTGPIIDSLSVRGKITDALTEKIPEKITVALYQSDTFDIYRHTPEYFTKSDKQGRFLISNLKAGNYRLYAFEDKNKNLKLETQSEKFGFLPGRIDPAQTSDSLRMPLVKLDARPLRLTTIRQSQKTSAIQLNKYLLRYKTTNPVGKHIVNAFGDNQTQIIFYHALPAGDSIQVRLTGTDSLTQTIDTLLYIKAGTSGTVPANFTPTLGQTTLSPETGTFTANVTFNKPLLKLSLDSVFLRIDSTQTIPITREDLVYDTIHNSLLFKKTLDLKLLTALTAPLEFYMSKNTLISIESDTSKLISKKISFPKPEELATLLFEVQTNQTDFVVELLTTDYKIVQRIRDAKKITFRNVPPAEYKIRIYLDKNKNNEWDPGNINQDIPPEPTYFFRTAAGTYQFPLRANWEVGPYTINF